MKKGCLVLSDGSIYEGIRFGSDKEVVCEVVFATGLTGYVELLTDPSFCGQAVTMAHPIVGNYGVFEDVSESDRVWVGAFIVRDITQVEGDARDAEDLDAYLKRNGVPGLYDIDTREITIKIREEGTKIGCIVNGDKASLDLDQIQKRIQAYDAKHLVPIVSPKEKRFYSAWVKGWDEEQIKAARKEGKTSEIIKNEPTEEMPAAKYDIAFLDFGAKRNIIWNLTERGCNVTDYPWDTTAEEILEQKPDGVFLSNGPGNPQDSQKAIVEIKKLIEAEIPMMGICLGHQLIALAVGGNTEKLKYGHRGANHPVREIEQDRVYITSQNHGFVVIEDSLPKDICEVSHVNVNDGTVEGLRLINKPVFTVQYHPEGAPGPQDNNYLFDRFIEMIETAKRRG